MASKDPRKLRRDAEHYEARARELEGFRGNINERLTLFMMSDIVPEVQRTLPEHYGIYRSLIRSNNIDPNRMPTKFYAELILSYEGRPVRSTGVMTFATPGEEGLYKIQKDVKERLQKLAEECGLTHVLVTGLPRAS